MRAPYVAAAALLLLPAAAAAQDCREQVEALADKLGLGTELPQSEPPAVQGQQPAPGDLAESDGVIVPPATGGDMPSIEPPAAESSNMPTAPQVRPQAPGGANSGSQAAIDAQVQALLTAARQVAEAGDDQGCRERLREASAIAADQGT